MALASEDRKRLFEALARRYRNREDLDEFIKSDLNENPENISSSKATLRTTYSDLIDWSIGESRLPELIAKLYERAGADVRKVLDAITTAPAGSEEESEFLFCEGQPFVDRDELHGKLLELAKPKGKRILLVRGQRQSGNSHARERIFRLAERLDFQYVDIRLEQFGPDVEIRPYDLGVPIAAAMKLTFSKEVSDPKDSRWAVNFMNWLQGNLQPRQRWWIIIDDFEPEKVSLAPAVYEFIELLASRMDGTLSSLRLVLITYERELPSSIRTFVEREDVQLITDEDVAEYFIRFYRDFMERGNPADVAADVIERVRRVRQKMAEGPKPLERMRDAIIEECTQLKGQPGHE